MLVSLPEVWGYLQLKCVVVCLFFIINLSIIFFMIERMTNKQKQQQQNDIYCAFWLTKTLQKEVTVYNL